MYKKLLLSIAYIILSSNIVLADDFSDFKKQLEINNYEGAMEIYSKHLNGLDTSSYQQELLNSVIEQISSNTQSAEDMINQFLQIEYNHPFGTYLLSQIKYMQEKYDESIDLMYQLQNSYLENDLSQKVNSSLPTMISGYLNILYDKQDMQNLDTLIDKFVNQNDYESINKWQEIIIKIASDEGSKQYYEQAMELLKKLKNYSMTDETNVKYQNLYDVLINNYLKEIQSNEDQEKLQKLIDDLLENKKPQLKKAEFLMGELKRKEAIKNVSGKRIALEKSNNQYFVSALINGLNSKLLVDTGATTTMINRSFMQQTNFIVVQHGIKLLTPSGQDSADLVQVGNFQIDNIVLNQFDIIVSRNDVFENFDGLLGMNFLKNFHFQIDTMNNQLILN